MAHGASRPGPVRWIAYAYGRRLPASMVDWVRNDLVGPHAFVRHLLRSQVIYVPVFVLLLLLPGPFWLAFLSFLLALLLSLTYAVIYMEQNRVRRLQAHGLPGDLESAKAQATRIADRDAYEATYLPQRPGR
ncbi:DUF5313 domain-containing protein [Rhodococcus antarcticus]|uniref:DUF5313 domain-containing protein n=1 Tax=Rhodococcus antarcticus TaxID=2987751 RepID=A0ABY6P478_9NOCA|nr:DUF5313 family protein [Rhodococcus antarcticus]UZJ26461.1 DUF5313 domain-containing protein [Rhodococcus antarcticus]